MSNWNNFTVAGKGTYGAPIKPSITNASCEQALEAAHRQWADSLSTGEDGACRPAAPAAAEPPLEESLLVSKQSVDEERELLAAKFYSFYTKNDFNLMAVARKVGPDLGRMIDHLMTLYETSDQDRREAAEEAEEKEEEHSDYRVEAEYTEEELVETKLKLEMAKESLKSQFAKAAEMAGIASELATALDRVQELEKTGQVVVANWKRAQEEWEEELDEWKAVAARINGDGDLTPDLHPDDLEAWIVEKHGETETLQDIREMMDDMKTRFADIIG
tara:strand:- start:13656 stop:14480 length:825 start_codon:yes stop_codon:yes gene_type:complete